MKHEVSEDQRLADVQITTEEMIAGTLFDYAQDHGQEIPEHDAAELGRRLLRGVLYNISSEDYTKLRQEHGYELDDTELIIHYQQFLANRLGVAWEEIDSDADGFLEAAKAWAREQEPA